MNAPENVSDKLAEGTYAKKQIFCKAWLVSWSHRRRFEFAQKLAASFPGERILDYGCGDGVFLAQAHAHFREAVGAEVSDTLVSYCRQHFASRQGLSFVSIKELSDPKLSASFDVAVCMEVLEHCVSEVRAEVIPLLRRLLKPTGVLIVSVPIEIGPSLIGKQIARTLAGWRGLGDYKHNEGYSLSEYAKMIFASADTAIDRPRYLDNVTDGPKYPYHGHKGFNWKALRRELGQCFAVERTLFTPMPWLRGLINSQAWFICRPRLERTTG